MKNFKLTLLILTALITVFSCKKDDDAPLTNAELIIGTWRWTAFSENGVDDLLDECDLMDTINFDGTTVTYTDHYKDSDIDPCTPEADSDPYSINGMTLMVDGDPEEIVTLNETTLTFKFTETYNSETYIYLETYTKQ